MQRGRPFQPGQSGNPRGRPRKKQPPQLPSLHELVEPRLQEIVERLIEEALRGNIQAIRIIADRCWPSLSPADQPVSLPEFSRAPMERRAEVVTKAVGAGKITPAQGKQLALLAESQARTVEVGLFREFLSRIKAGETTEGVILDLTTRLREVA